MPPEHSPAQQRVVGLALKKEKRKKHISDKVLQLAAEAGITLRFIDKELPLEEQGPFVAILQKVRKPEWEAELVAYAARHPEVQVFDLPHATYPLRNRGTMVSFLDGNGWLFEEPASHVEPGRRPLRCRCNVPTNTTLAAGSSYEEAMDQLEAAGLRFPLLAKPLWADGREGSHALAVVHTPRGLERLVAGEAAYLQLPVMVQQYVDHGGCLFKVYVMGDTSVRVKRSSLHLPQWSSSSTGSGCRNSALPSTAGAAAESAATAAAVAQQPPQQQKQEQQQGGADVAATAAAAGGAELAPSQPLPDLELLERVSAYPASKSWGKADTAPKGHGVPSPPAWLLQALAQRLRRKLGLNLFNFDVIVPMHLHRRRDDGGLPRPQQPYEQSEAGGCDMPASSTAAAAAGSGAAPVGGRVQQEQLQQHQNSAGAAAAGSAGAGGEEGDPVALDLRAATAEAEAACNGSNAAAASDPMPQQQVQQQEPPPQQQQQQAAEGEELLYHLIDINYFPGYEKMPNYEHYMVQFLRSICYPEQAAAEQQAQQQQTQQQAPVAAAP